MTVFALEEVSGGCTKITSSEGPSFFLRLDYLRLIKPESLCCGAAFSGEELEDIFQAAFAFAAERDAVLFLGRSEQCRHGLRLKLEKKGHCIQAVEAALDRLEAQKVLDDLRFAKAWLHNRLITRAEGPARLCCELARRGIKREVIDEALNDLMQNIAVDDVFFRALRKLRRLGKSGKKLENALMRKGFDYRLIKSAKICE